MFINSFCSSVRFVVFSFDVSREFEGVKSERNMKGTDRQTDKRQTDKRQTDKQTNRQTDKQTEEKCELNVHVFKECFLKLCLNIIDKEKKHFHSI